MNVLSCKTNVEYESVVGALTQWKVILAGQGGGHYEKCIKNNMGNTELPLLLESLQG